MSAERVYRLLLQAFPREFREDVGGEMAALFRARHREERARGRPALARLWARTVWDVARNALPERIAAWTAAPPPGARRRRKGQAMDTLAQDLRYAARSLVRAQDPRIFACLVARTTGDPAAMAGALRQAFWSVDPEQPVWKVRPMEDLMRASLGSSRAMATLVGVFAGVSVLLAAVGLYGVMSYAVSLRTREIGIRMALGARSREVMRLVVGRGMALTFMAVAIGVLGAAALSRLLATLLFGVKTTDAATFAAAAALMSSVSLLASYLPARRAARLDPLSALAGE